MERKIVVSLGGVRIPIPEDFALPGSASIRPRCTARLIGAGEVPGARREVQAAAPRQWWIPLLLGAMLALGACQDAYNADNSFNFNNPNDPTPTTTSGPYIAGISFDNTGSDTYVVIVNGSSISVDMSGWSLVNTTTYNGTHTTATFYAFAITLGAGSFVRVHSSAAPAGGDTSTDLYGGPSWAFNDRAELEQPGGGGVSSCMVGSPTC